MALVRSRNVRPVPGKSWDLGNFPSSVFQEFDQFFNQVMPSSYSTDWMQGYPIDLYETGEHVVLEMAVPGIHADDLDISVEGRQLSITGNLPNITDNDERRYWLQGIPRGQFSRTVTLPANVEVDDINASIKEGLLTLTMPKVAEAKARKIAITNG